MKERVGMMSYKEMNRDSKMIIKKGVQVGIVSC